MERCHEYHGVYHVLHGALSPLDGIQPDSFIFANFWNVCVDDTVKEIIMATDPDAEGEDSLYIAGLAASIGTWSRASREVYRPVEISVLWTASP